MAIPRIYPYLLPKRADLPTAHVPWRPDPARAVLLIHDMQNFFVDAFPAGCAPIVDIVENIARLRTQCERAGIPIAYTAQPGGMTDRQRGLVKDFWGSGMSTDPAHRAIIGKLSPGPADRVFTKWRYSAFHRSGLTEFLQETGRDQLLICGVYAHIGCLMTAADAFAHDVENFMVADALGDFELQRHMWALEYAAQCCSVPLVTAQVLEALDPARRSVLAG